MRLSYQIRAVKVKARSSIDVLPVTKCDVELLVVLTDLFDRLSSNILSQAGYINKFLTVLSIW